MARTCRLVSSSVPGGMYTTRVKAPSIIGVITDIRIYNFPNAGGWYDFGFLIGASMFLGGGGASAK